MNFYAGVGIGYLLGTLAGLITAKTLVLLERKRRERATNHEPRDTSSHA